MKKLRQSINDILFSTINILFPAFLVFAGVFVGWVAIYILISTISGFPDGGARPLTPRNTIIPLAMIFFGLLPLIIVAIGLRKLKEWTIYLSYIVALSICITTAVTIYKRGISLVTESVFRNWAIFALLIITYYWFNRKRFR